ncbi:DUF2256 domain-containing protein [Pseudodonghicola sp.]|uniref:DUF2256 domain-containing protein n=1 Tax=Pseudodonghicola sp. TaxID=1969463 RepID=UPI003A96B214
MQARRRSDLPVKIRAVCGRPFTWRRRWARDWDPLRYCSRGGGGGGAMGKLFRRGCVAHVPRGQDMRGKRAQPSAWWAVNCKP